MWSVVIRTRDVDIQILNVFYFVPLSVEIYAYNVVGNLALLFAVVSGRFDSCSASGGTRGYFMKVVAYLFLPRGNSPR